MAALPLRPDPPSFRVDGADRLAGVLEDAEPVLAGQLLQLRHRRRPTENVDRQNPDRLLPHRLSGCPRIEVEGQRIDVAEHRPRPLVEQAVGRCDEAEGAGDHLVALAPAEAPHPEVKRRSTAGDCDRVLDPQPERELTLEALQHRAQRQAAGAKRLQHQRLLSPPQLRARKRNLLAALRAHRLSLVGPSSQACASSAPTDR